MRYTLATILTLVSLNAAAVVSCNDTSTFPQVTKHVNGKAIQIAKCVPECLQVTPYTSPRCVDYDNVLGIRPKSKYPSVSTVTAITPAPSGASGSVVPPAGAIDCLDTTTFPTQTNSGVTYPVCVKSCAKDVSFTAVASWAESATTVTLLPADAANVRVKMAVTGSGIVANTKANAVNSVTGAVVISIPASAAGTDATLTFTVPAVVSPTCVGFYDEPVQPAP